MSMSFKIVTVMGVWYTDIHILKEHAASIFRDYDGGSGFFHSVGADVTSQKMVPSGLV
jgi:hypothetical protein